MGTSGGSRGAVSAAFNLPTSRSAVIDRAGALPLILAPAEMLDDPRRVADRLAADLEHGHHGLPRELLDAGPAATPPRDPPLLGLDPAPGELAGHPPARAQAVR